jgi:hypothetical protein
MLKAYFSFLIVITISPIGFTQSFSSAKLGKLIVQNSELAMENAIPTKVSYPNTSILYTHIFNQNNWAYEGKKYYTKIIDGNTTTTEPLQVTNKGIIDIITNEFYLVEDEKSNYLNYYSDLNDDCDFDLSKIFYKSVTSSAGIYYKFIKPTFDKELKQIKFLDYQIFKEFEYSINNNIETFNIKSCKGGKNGFGFISSSNYSNKPYLFTYDFSSNNLEYIDLSTLRINDKFSYNMNDATLKSLIFLGQTKYIVLQCGNKLLPIIIKRDSKIDSKTVIENQVFMGVYKENTYKGWSGDLYNLWNNSKTELNGFINAYSENTSLEGLKYKIKLFNKSFNKIWEMNLNGIRINAIKEVNGFLIIGGFTIEKGYVGYPNPRVIVVNKITKQITYDNVIPQKNGTIAMIGFDGENNIEFTTCCFSSSCYNTNFTPYIIRDKLNFDGKFENNLFN